MDKPNVLPFSSVPNARDLGGYIGADGRKIKMHRLLRTGKLNTISDQDMHGLIKYGLKEIVDLRSLEEVKNLADKPISGVVHVNDPVFAKDLTQANVTIAKLNKAYDYDQYAGFKRMCLNYHEMISQPHAQRACTKLFERLAKVQDGAIIFHCSEGKDRTGMATVFLLTILGVDSEIIRQDYLYSNYLLNDYRAKRDKFAKEHGDNDILRANLRSLGSVANEYLDTALIEIDRDFNGMEAYLKNQLKVTSELKKTLQDLYLEK